MTDKSTGETDYWRNAAVQLSIAILDIHACGKGVMCNQDIELAEEIIINRRAQDR